MCDSCLAHFYHPEAKPPYVELDPPASIEARENIELRRKVQSLEDKVRQLETEREENGFWKGMFDILALGIKVTAEKRDDLPGLDIAPQTIWALFSADERGVYVENPQTGEKNAVMHWDAQNTLPAEYLALCRYPYLQDESCKLPGGHIGDHGPKHQCDIDCGLSPDGCTLPVPANPVAYYKALYWEIHGGSCPPTCRGHASV